MEKKCLYNLEDKNKRDREWDGKAEKEWEEQTKTDSQLSDRKFHTRDNGTSNFKSY